MSGGFHSRACQPRAAEEEGPSGTPKSIREVIPMRLQGCDGIRAIPPALAKRHVLPLEGPR